MLINTNAIKKKLYRELIKYKLYIKKKYIFRFSYVASRKSATAGAKKGSFNSI